MAREGEIVVDLDSVLDEMEMGFEPDGLPKTQPKEPTAKKAREPEKDETPDRDEEKEQLRREKEELARTLEAERSARTKAEEIARRAADASTESERLANTRTEQAMQAHWAKINAEHDHIESQLNASKTELASAKREWLAAREAGDAAREVDAQIAMSQAQSVMSHLEAGRIAAKDEIKRTHKLFEQYSQNASAPRETPKPEPKPEPAAEQPRPQTADDWIDNSKAILGDEMAAWLRDHKEFVSNDKLHLKFMNRVNEFAVEHGRSALKGSEFKKSIEKEFFPKKAEQEQADDTEDEAVDIDDTPPPKKAAAPSAPVSRSSPARPSTSMQGGKVRLTADEQATAVQMYPDIDRNAAIKRYASNKARAIADGRYQ